MKTIDYNRTGFWSHEAVTVRYEKYVWQFHVLSPGDLKPDINEGKDAIRIYPVMEKVIKGIEKNDLACIEIGIEFIEENASFPFGKILKYNTARALRRASEYLTDNQKDRIRKRVVEMLCTGYLPREFRQYAKLARKIGLGIWQKKIERKIWQKKTERKKDVWVKHYYQLICHNPMDK